MTDALAKDIWKSPQRLVRLADSFDQEALGRSIVSDDEFLARIRETYWSTNLWCFAQEVVAIVAHACSLRPHLAADLVADLVDPTMAGGLDEAQEAGACFSAVLNEVDPYVPLTPRGRKWLQAQQEHLAALLVSQVREAMLTDRD